VSALAGDGKWTGYVFAQVECALNDLRGHVSDSGQSRNEHFDDVHITSDQGDECTNEHARGLSLQIGVDMKSRRSEHYSGADIQ
jgi:hypothetical protein